MKKEVTNKSGRLKYIPYAITKDIVTEMFPVEKEDRIPTMDKPLMIESACPGFQMGGTRFPAVPISIADQINAQAESVNAGAVIIHVHARDPETGEAQMNNNLLARVLDGIFDKVGDCITFTHSWYPVPNAEVDYIIGTEELLELGKGNKYVQASLLGPVGFRIREQSSYMGVKGTVEGIKWLEAHKVKPVHQLLDTYSHLGFKRHVFDQGIAKWKPFIMNIQIGKHDAAAANKDPWSYLQFITSMSMINENIPDHIIGVYPGGRNWLPMTVMGIMMRADLVRVGIEDCYWLYPHKDEVIKKNSDVVKMAADIAHLLGRRVVTDPKEARKILGMKLTSKL